MHLCHWPNALVSLTILYIRHRLIVSRHSCHWSNAFVSLTSDSISESVSCIRVIDQMHWCHWPFSIRAPPNCVSAFVSLTECIRVIDHWPYIRVTQMHSCHWPNALVSLTILYIGHHLIVSRHSCHWPNALVSLTTDSISESVTCICVIDQMHWCHWPFSI